jgi:hypothetical protein
MKQIQPGDQVLGMGLDGETIEVYRVVKVAADGVQVEETSGKLSKAGLRVHDEHIFRQIQERDRQVKALKQEIRKLYEGLEAIG